MVAAEGGSDGCAGVGAGGDRLCCDAQAAAASIFSHSLFWGCAQTGCRGGANGATVGGGDGEGGNRTCWIGTPAGAVVAGPGLSGSGAGCCSGAMATMGPARGWDGHGNQGGVVAATAAETARCGGCHGRSSGPVVAAGGGP